MKDAILLLIMTVTNTLIYGVSGEWYYLVIGILCSITAFVVLIIDNIVKQKEGVKAQLGL